ncbi:MAG TPA: methyltransferase domain-containing protein [Candidatus Limnocylindria bacterium]|nr:methyltransferase domain-containing protein [Candidatus Limnocylindria bacterium]
MSQAHDHEHEAPFGEGDPRAWDRPIRDSELYLPERRDAFNFIDETKIRHLRPLLPPEGTAVEVGAGSGRLLVRLGLERPYRLVAVDYAPYAVRAVKENLRRAGLEGEVIMADARALPLDDGSADVVLSGGLLEHFREPLPIVREMARILRPGGLFYADIVPRKVSLYRWAERGRMERSDQLSEGIYESALPKAAWARLVRDAGLVDVRIVSAGVYPPYTFPRHERLMYRYAEFIRGLDGTAVADVLGFFYMVTARKR